MWFALIGKDVRRKEDFRLITGRGSFLDDLKLDGMLYASFLRSPLGHAKIRSIDLPTVFSQILTGKDLDLILPMISVWPGKLQPPFPLLAKDEVLYFGQLVAAVASESRAKAEDVLELIDVNYEGMPIVVDAEKALAEGSVLVHEDLGTNLIGSWKHEAGNFESAIANADVVIDERFQVKRVTGQAIEPRGAIANYDQDSGELHVWLTSQDPHMDRTLLAECLKIPENKIRVFAQDVGGGFGINSHLYPEQILTCVLAIRSKRPVKWVEDRREHVQGAIHSGDTVQQITLAAKKDGTILGIRDKLIQNCGAYLQTRHIVSTFVAAVLVPGPYRVPCYSAEIEAVFTNKGPVGTYRAFGMTQASFARERMMDLLAAKLGMDPVLVRKKNLIAKDQFPFTNPAGQQYDSGDYETTLDLALKLSEYYEHKQKLKKEGSVSKGVGLGVYLEIGGVGALDTLPTKGQRYVPKETARLALDRDGRVLIYSGVAPTGQGLETTLSQIAAEEMMVPLDSVVTVHGDTDSCPYSGDGTIASRSANLAGNAVLIASRMLKEKITAIAATILGVNTEEVTYLDGVILANGRTLSLAELAKLHYLKQGSEIAVTGNYEPQVKSGTTTFGVHIAFVTVDKITGFVKLDKIVMVHDCGRMLNSMIVDGMAHGGIAQGISAALLEEVAYGDQGEILASTFGDYMIPTAFDVPTVVVGNTVTPSPTNPLGVKGGGEGGIVGMPAAIANAVGDAVGVLAVLDKLPLRPDALRQALRS